MPLEATAETQLSFAINSTTAPVVICEGWVLKKRRKKMQGFARRYFVLYSTGLLQYSFEPGQPVRDQVSLQHAAISTALGRKDIHVDSDRATFHIKCLSQDDFTMWMAALRKFISLGIEARKSLSSRQSIRQASISLTRTEGLVEGMTGIIEHLEQSVLSLLDEVPLKKAPTAGKRFDKERHKEHPKDMVFSLFKKHPHHPPEELDADPPELDLPPIARDVLRTLEQLKSHHALLLKSTQARTVGEAQSVYQSPLLPAVEEPSHEDDTNSNERSPRSTSSSAHHRYSIATTVSDNTHEWYDAVDHFDGPEEFLLEPRPISESVEPSSHILSTDSLSSFGQPEQDDDGTEVEERTPEMPSEPKSDAKVISRRTRLPSPVVGDEGSLFAILKKNVGKDLSTITLPVTFNEPLTLLQRVAEELEYFNLLDEAAQMGDPVDRISYVAAFAVSGYAHTRHRSGRKGFNPLLAETFEDVRMKLVVEKVQHNPVEMAYHAEGGGWELTGISAGRTKFWGKSLEIIPQGTIHLRIGNDHFTWTKPSSFIRNLMVGTKYLEHCGGLTVENHTNGYRCALEFKQSGYWGPSNLVSGPVYSPGGEIVSRLEGRWDDQISQALDSSHFRLLWRMNTFPREMQDYYGFTAFGITLNEIVPDFAGKLPPTDSRYRPDVRALENGEIEEAEGIKLDIEEMQRERRKQGKDRQPRWFKRVGNEWVYAGGYWETRARGWEGENIQPLW